MDGTGVGLFNEGLHSSHDHMDHLPRIQTCLLASLIIYASISETKLAISCIRWSYVKTRWCAWCSPGSRSERGLSVSERSRRWAKHCQERYDTPESSSKSIFIGPSAWFRRNARVLWASVCVINKAYFTDWFKLCVRLPMLFFFF